MSRVSINETTLTAIGDAIRGKTGKSELIAPGDMPAEITGIVSGGGADPVIEELQITANGTYNAYDGVDGFAPVVVNVPQDGAPTAEELAYTGNMENAFANGRFDWVINKYGNLMTTDKVKNISSMFANTKVEQIPFAINFDSSITSSSYADMSHFCGSAMYLKTVPVMNNFKPYSMSYMFTECYSLREFPEDAFDSWNWTFIDDATSGYGGNMNQIVSYCYSLRKYPMEILNHGNPTVTSSNYHVYNYMCQNCHSLDEIVNIPAPSNASASCTTTIFKNSFVNCYRLKELTFVPGITLNWTYQTLDLSQFCGYCIGNQANSITNWNSGITTDKAVSDDATYQALKNDPDWYATKVEYSRYNKTSAINTINSLPTIISGGTIKFKGEAGSATDGGAINTLTDAQIAVATEKGWTVSFV